MRKVILFAFLFFTIGCSNSKTDEETDIETDKEEVNVDDFLNKLQSVLSTDISKENLPEWLNGKINEIEVINSKDISIVKVLIYMGEWRNRTVYFIYHNLSSCILCEVYYENGTKIVWTPKGDTSYDFCNNSKNWILIYKFGLRTY